MAENPVVGLPHDSEAEWAILALTLVDPQRLEELVSRLDEDAFYEPVHRELFRVFKKIHENGQSLTIPRIREYLASEGKLTPDIENMLMNMSLRYTLADVPVYWDGFLDIVVEKATLRKIAMAGRSLIELAQYYDSQPERTMKKIIDEAERKLFEHLGERELGSAVHIMQAVNEFISYVEKFDSDDYSHSLVIPTEIPDLDDILNGGLGRSDLIIVAARPSVGKTALALHIALTIAQKYGVIFFSLEMPAVQIAARALSNVGGFNAMAVMRRGFRSDTEAQKLGLAISKLENLEFYIDDTSALTVFDIKSRARKLNTKLPEDKKLGLVVVDYLQLIKGTKGSRANRVQEIGQMTMELKQLARELDIPVIVVSQLSREVEKRQDKRPMLSDLRESGSIEQDADVVILLYREDYYERDEDTAHSSVSDIILDIAKNRHGRTDVVKLKFDRNSMHFYTVEAHTPGR